MTQYRLAALGILQRKMMRRIVGWRKIPGEDWRDTMVRMNRRLQTAQVQYYCEPWSIRFARNQWRYVKHLIHGPISLWARTLCKYNWNPHFDPTSNHEPFRAPGHPRTRWDDHIHDFCKAHWPHYGVRHWFDILVDVDMNDFEDEFVVFVCNERS